MLEIHDYEAMQIHFLTIYKLKNDLEKFENVDMISMKLVIPLDSLYWSIHTKDESKRGTGFAFIFGVN